MATGTIETISASRVRRVYIARRFYPVFVKMGLAGVHTSHQTHFSACGECVCIDVGALLLVSER
jgi:hypothetical protein